MIRVVNRVLVVVIGCALAAAGALVIIDGIQTWTNNGFVWIPGDTWLSSFKTTVWSDPSTIAISVVVGVLGLLLLVAAIAPQRPRVAPFRTDQLGG